MSDTSITVIYHGMSLTVLYVYHSDLSWYVSDCTVRICCFFTKYAALRNKSREKTGWLWIMCPSCHMSNYGLLFQ